MWVVGAQVKNHNSSLLPDQLRSAEREISRAREQLEQSLSILTGYYIVDQHREDEAAEWLLRCECSPRY